MRIEYKIFLTILFTTLSVPSLLFSWLLMKIEYQEYFLYGDIKAAKIVNIDSEPSSSSGEYGVDYTFEIEILNDSEFDKKRYLIFILVNHDSALQNNNDIKFVSNAKINDLISVKIMNDHQAKVLNWNDKEINKKTNYHDKFWTWILICFLLGISFLLYYKIVKIIKK
ncbi:hypothetical protein ACE939_11100 [Aquimarina sp. W85]|uniref:hypothetical protein n=1 Tax=Aquimarina rhodophyticola TaxID=3342246 RepID=UPI0036706C3E